MDFSSRILAAAASVEQFPLGVRASVNPPVPTSTKNIAVLGNTVVVTNGFATFGGFVTGSLSYSLDAGATWNTKNVIDPTTGAIVYLNAIVADPIIGQFIAATTPNSAVRLLFRSTNGVDWSLIPGTTFSDSINALFYFSSGLYPYILSGGGGSGLFSSLDGLTWTSLNSGGIAPDSIAYGNNTYILVVRSSTFGGNVRRTTDFVSYTTPAFTQLTPSITTFGSPSVVFVNNTFIISVLVSKVASRGDNRFLANPCTSFIFKSTDNGLNFSLATPGEAYLSNVQYGMIVNSTDNFAQSRPSATTDYSGETTYSYPNRGNPLSFSSPTYTLTTRLTTQLTTTTSTPTVFGINSIDTSPDLPNNIFGFGGYRINRVEIEGTIFGQWSITTYSNASPNGSPRTVTQPALLNATLRTALQNSGTKMQGYAFVLGSLTYIFFFANALVSGTHYFGTTAYSTADGVTFTEFSALPAEFNVSGATSASGADYNLTILRGEFGAGGYSYAFNYGPVSAVNIRYMTSATGTSAWTVRTTRVVGSQYVSYSANDGTGSAGWIGYLSNGGTGVTNNLVFQRSNNFTLAFTDISVAGLDATPVLFTQCTDMTFISSAFRLFCNFNDLLGQPVWGVISITTAGVVSYTVISNFSNMKVLGTANSTVFVISMDTGAVYTSTDGTTYTLRTTWDSPAMSEDIFTAANGSVYTSGRFLTSTLFRSTNTANWFTSANGSSWTGTPVTTPSSSALALRASYPSKYVDTQSGQKVAIFTGVAGVLDGQNATDVGVANAGSSLAVMPYKNLSINNPLISFSAVAQISSGYIAPIFGGTARLNSGDTAWTITQDTFDPDTQTAPFSGGPIDRITTALAQGSLITYVYLIDTRLYQATQLDPDNRSLVSLPTIGTDYSRAQVVTDGIKIFASVYSTVGGAARRNYVSTDDGATWTAVTNAGSQDSLLYADPGKTAAGLNKFALAFANSISVTADAGNTWNTSTITLNPISDVSFADGMWVACGRIQTGNSGSPLFRPFFTGRIFSSVNDGVSWTQQYTTTTTTSTAISLRTIAPTGNAKQFVCSGIGNNDNSVVLLSNTSGTTYVETTGQFFTSIEYGAGGSPVLLAQRSDNVIYGSNDGSTWTQQSQFALPSTAVIVYTGQKWFVTVPTSSASSFTSTNGTYIYSI